MGKLSVVISAYNEERNIGECLESIKDIADEIIVVDNSSTDKTREIAKKHTKKVFEQKNDPKNIDLLKNFGFSKATGEWILSIDADERITHELSGEIREKIGNSRVNGYWIPRRNIIFGKWIKNDMWWPDYQLRLFRKGKGRFGKEEVHRALVLDGASEKLINPIIHYNYASVRQYLEKLNNYTDIEADRLTREGYKFNWLDAIRFPVNDFVKIFFLQKGFKDGLHGLVLSILQAFYMEVVFAKLWEKEGFREVESKNFLQEVILEFKESKNKIIYWITSSLIDESKNPLKKIGLKIKRKILI
jgi:glycosyltransferase involved in cell wall biosynthesis